MTATAQGNGNGSKGAGDKLERLLRRDAAALIEDDGFTSRVMHALPRERALRGRSAWLTPALVLGSTALGSLLAWIFAPDGGAAIQGFFDLASRNFTSAAIGTLATAGALLACAIVLAAHTD